MQTVLFLTRRCNMACSYCYLHPERGNPDSPVPALPDIDMPLERVIQAIDWTLENSVHDGSIGLGFFGGEPFLARTSLVKAVHHAEVRAKELHIPLGLSIATNGTLLMPPDARFLAKHKFLVQLSLDGIPPAHDAHRVYTNGTPTAAAVLRSLRLLQHHHAHVEIACVITPTTVQWLPESFRRLTRDLGIRRINLAVSVTDAWDDEGWKSLYNALVMVKDEIVALYREGVTVVVDLFDEKIRAHIDGGYKEGQYCPFGQGKVAIDVDGTIYPCDRIAGPGLREDVAIGTLDTGIDIHKATRLRKMALAPKLPCDQCPIPNRCRHWCGCINRDATSTVGHVSEFFCNLERLKVKLADELAETLYSEHNSTFMDRFYNS